MNIKQVVESFGIGEPERIYQNKSVPKTIAVILSRDIIKHAYLFHDKKFVCVVDEDNVIHWNELFNSTNQTTNNHESI